MVEFANVLSSAARSAPDLSLSGRTGSGKDLATRILSSFLNLYQ